MKLMSVFGVILLLPLLACIDTKIKELQSTSTRTFKTTATSSLSSFRISYASKYLSTNNYVLIQGVSTSANAISTTCGSTGASCFCDFYNSSGTLLESSGGVSTSIKYSSSGDIVTCKIPTAALADVAKVRLRNSSGSSVTDTATILSTVATGADTDLPLAKLIGANPTSSVRSIYSYQCYFIARQETGLVTGGTPTCTDQAIDFNILKATYNFYLYASSNSSITGLRATQHILNNTLTCGLMTLQIDCNSISSALTKDFGVLSESSGAFTTAVKANTAPTNGLVGYQNGYNETQGYAMPTSIFLDSHCPLGTTEKSLYVITPSDFDGDMGGSNDMPDVADRQIRTTGATIDTACTAVNEPCIPVQKLATDGTCALGTCSAAPSGAASDFTSANWPKLSTEGSTESTFCVINSSLLQ
jgi:hypothetical protein